MISRSIKMAGLAVGIGMLGAVVASAPTAWAAGNSGSATGTFIDFQGSFPGPVPANCPAVLRTDDLGLYFISGNASPSRGAIEGNAYYVDVTQGIPLFLGYATVWGNDKAFTVTFHGTSDSGQTIDFHMIGNPRSLQQLDTMTCS